MSGPDEISDADYNELSADDIDGQLADEERSNAPLGNWLFQPGVDSMNWPKAIIACPVELSAPEYTDEKLIALARQRLAMEVS